MTATAPRLFALDGHRGAAETPPRARAGLNALEILAWLRQAEAAGWKEAGAAAAALKEDHGYGRQAVNARITAPDDENFSDDELLVFPLFGHLVYARGADRDPELLCAFSRAWAAGLGRQRGALWGAMHYAVLQDVVTRDEAARRVYETCAAAASPFVAPASVEDRLAAAAADVAWGLENWPLDPVKWGVDQTARGDVELDRVAGRFGEAQLMSVLPPNERSALRWNANPFAAAEGPSSNGDGSAAEDPGAFLLAYRLGKHYGLV